MTLCDKIFKKYIGGNMKHSTLCYIEKDDAYLMMHRIKKINDENHDKWVGIGGKLEPCESPFDCVIREIKEETGLDVTDLRYRGFITFVSDLYGTEYMHLFTADGYIGKLNDVCEEGNLEWVKKCDVPNLPIWEGDKIFFDLLEKNEPFFSLKLVYKGDELVDYKVN